MTRSRYSGEIERLRRRLYSQTPLIGGWRRRRAARELAAEGSMAAVRALARAVVKSEDEGVRGIALGALEALDDWRGISAACEVWAETRDGALTALMVEKGWVASTPPAVKVLSALKVGAVEAVTGGDARVVEPLVAACEDPDPVIAARARQALPRLEKEEAQERVCRVVVETGDGVAREAARRGGYCPREEEQRALFFFLTGQWERYEGLDFDQRLLRAAYAAADERVRRRVRETLRAAGRTEFLTVIAGKGYDARAAEMGPEELDLLMGTLVANAEWPELWDLVCEVDFCRSAGIVETLHGAGWRPEDGESGALFGSLVSLVEEGDGLPASAEALRRLFPPALLKARARVAGRINDVAFSPARPTIAIGTGARKVVTWNYQRGERELLLGEFGHSIGEVAFSGDGALLWAERTNATDVPCAIYRWHEGDGEEAVSVLGRHVGSVTALVPTGESRMVSAGRDKRVVLWDVREGRALSELETYDWARGVAVSPDGRCVALLRRGLTLMTLPDFGEAVFASAESVGRCAAFLPDGYDGGGGADGDPVLLVGQYNGDVMVFRRRSSYWLAYDRATFSRHAGRAEGVSVLRGRGVAITAGSEGAVRFTDLDDGGVIGEVEAPEGRVTSLHVSPDEAFIAVGNSEASLSLWDIRGLDALDALLNPFGGAAAATVGALAALAADEGLSPRARRTLTFAERVLRHRFRFDIEIGPAPTIMAGEFDIEIE